MIRFSFVIVFFVWVIIPSFSQKVVKGAVFEQYSRKPVAFVNIGILGSNVGSISNADGSFAVSIPESLSGDTLLFSALGYGTRRIPVSIIKTGQPFTILLPEKIIELDQVTVSARREKKKNFWLGNKYHKGGNIYADSVAAGSAMALLIENKYPAYHEDLVFPVFIEKAVLMISVNTFDEFKVRVRFLEVDSITQLPGKDIFDESVIVTSNIKKGWLTFDLSSFNFKIDKSRFFLAFEWILDDNDRLNLMDRYKKYQKENPEKVTVDTVVVRGEKVRYYNWNNFVAGTSFGVSPIQFSLDNYHCYYRNNSFGEWNPGATILTARLLVSNQPPTIINRVSERNKPDEMTNCSEQPAICETIKLCQDFMDQGTINGMQLTISVKENTVFSKGFGLSDILSGDSVTTKTRFRIGSISKSLTSAALVKLAAENKLDLDDPVRKYVPSYPKKQYTFTTRQLAGHLAGIRHYNTSDTSDMIRTDHFKNASESVSIFMNDSLLFKPGTQYHYSSFGWNLIGSIIEHASQQNYLDYMYNNIWQPLGMMQTYGDIADSIMVDKSKFYAMTGEEARKYDLSDKFPSGGLISTTEDLVRYGNELLYGSFLDPILKKQLFLEQHTSDGTPTKYGLGWNIVRDKNGHRVWYHAGILMEGSGYLLIYPDDDIVVAFLANSSDGISFDIQSIGEQFYKKKIVRR